MTSLFTILAQSVTGAVITIVALLLVAAIIGYLTAWFYAKSVYSPIIKGLEADKAELQKEVAALKDELSKLKAKVDELNGTIKKLEEEHAGKLAEKEDEIKELKSRIKE